LPLPLPHPHPPPPPTTNSNSNESNENNENNVIIPYASLPSHLTALPFPLLPCLTDLIPCNITLSLITLQPTLLDDLNVLECCMSDHSDALDELSDVKTALWDCVEECRRVTKVLEDELERGESDKSSSGLRGLLNSFGRSRVGGSVVSDVSQLNGSSLSNGPFDEVKRMNVKLSKRLTTKTNKYMALLNSRNELNNELKAAVSSNDVIRRDNDRIVQEKIVLSEGVKCVVKRNSKLMKQLKNEKDCNARIENQFVDKLRQLCDVVEDSKIQYKLLQDSCESVKQQLLSETESKKKIMQEFESYKLAVQTVIGTDVSREEQRLKMLESEVEERRKGVMEEEREKIKGEIERIEIERVRIKEIERVREEESLRERKHMETLRIKEEERLGRERAAVELERREIRVWEEKEQRRVREEKERVGREREEFNRKAKAAAAAAEAAAAAAAAAAAKKDRMPPPPPPSSPQYERLNIPQTVPTLPPVRGVLSGGVRLIRKGFARVGVRGFFSKKYVEGWDQ
jgi:hypothetical protein